MDRIYIASAIVMLIITLMELNKPLFDWGRYLVFMSLIILVLILHVVFIA